jgi:iron complex transport system ATP-binding protein
MTQGNEPGLHARRIRVRYDKTSILEKVSFSVMPGEVVGLIGPNGAGKSTLLRALLGLVPIERGAIEFEGKSLADMTPKDRARHIAYAPQGAPIHWPLTVQRLVELGRVPHMGPWSDMRNEDRAQVEAALRITQTDELRDRIVTSLSGGERASVMLARAIAVGAPYLLADEPVASLDPYHQIEVMEVLCDLAERGKGIVVVLHDLTLAMRFCDRIALLDYGSVVAKGRPKAVLTEENLERVYRIEAAMGEHNGVPYLVPWSRFRDE